MIYKGQIDVTKIAKGDLFKGKKGTYLDITIRISDNGPDKYGNDGMITQDVPKERREAGERGAILGNVKLIAGGRNQAPSQPSAPPRHQPPIRDEFSDDLASDDIPF